MRRPLVYLTCAFCLGLIFAACLAAVFWILLIFLFLSIGGACLFLPKSKQFYFFVFFAFFLIGACHFNQSQHLPANHIAHFAKCRGIKVRLRGIVVDAADPKKNKTVFKVQAQKLEHAGKNIFVQGKVLVCDFRKRKFDFGDALILEGTLYQPFPLQISSRLNYRDYLARNDIYAQLNVKSDGRIIVASKNQGNFLLKLIFSLRNKIKKKIEGNLSFTAAGIINAMILGFRSDVPDFFNKALQKSGTVHILAVSGLHTGIIVCLVLVFLRIFPLYFRTRYVLVIAILIFYCLMTGCRISVLRATIMVSVFLLAQIISRDYDPLSALSLSALIILWIKPMQIFDAGFQLSFLSVLFIFLYANKVTQIFSGMIRGRANLKILISSISVSISAWLGTLGVVAYFFNIITPIAVLANLFVIPLLFLLVLSAVIFLMLGSLAPIFSQALALNCEFFIFLIFKVNSLLLKIPGAYFRIENVSLKWGMVYYLVISLVFNLEHIINKLRLLYGRK